jgi:molybdenum cofactor synthesis domain-containing protein
VRKVPVEKAVGLALGHDITEIIPDKGVKHRAFRRGHVIAAEDVERLRDLGKNAVYVAEPGDTDVHEDDAALAVAPLAAGANIEHDPEPYEGKISFRAACDGLFLVDVERLLAINSLAIPALPTLPTHYPVRAGQTVAAFRIIPLTCPRDIVDQVQARLAEPLLEVRPYTRRTVGVIVTGSEVYEGRIEDRFVPRITAAVSAYGARVTESVILPDDRPRIAAEVNRLAGSCDLVFVTGGTSVDPDDVTVQAMQDAGVVYEVKGMPVQPGNNFTVGYRGELPVCAVPAATLFFRATAFDLLLPRLLAGLRVTREEIFRLGHGGLAQPGAETGFPDCSFGLGR